MGVMKEEGEERRGGRKGRGRDVGSETGGRIFQFFYTGTRPPMLEMLGWDPGFDRDK